MVGAGNPLMNTFGLMIPSPQDLRHFLNYEADGEESKSNNNRRGAMN